MAIMTKASRAPLSAERLRGAGVLVGCSMLKARKNAIAELGTQSIRAD